MSPKANTAPSLVRTRVCAAPQATCKQPSGARPASVCTALGLQPAPSVRVWPHLVKVRARVRVRARGRARVSTRVRG